MKQLAIYHDNKTTPSLFIDQKRTVEKTMESYLSSYREYLTTYNKEVAIININKITQVVEINKHPVSKPNQIEFVSRFRYKCVN